MDYLLVKSMEKYDTRLGGDEKAKILESLFPYLLRIHSEVSRSRHLTEFSARLGVDRDAVFRQFNHFSSVKTVDAVEIRNFVQDDIPTAERELLRYLFHLPEMAGKIMKDIILPETGIVTRHLLHAIQENTNPAGCLDIKAWETSMAEQDRQIMHLTVAREGPLVSEIDARNCLLALVQRALERQCQELSVQLSEAEKNQDMTRFAALQKEKQTIYQQIIEIVSVTSQDA